MRIVPAPLIQLCYVTRAERRTAISLCANTISDAGGSILDSHLFSNVSVSLLIEIPRPNLHWMADHLKEIGLVPTQETDAKVEGLKGAAPLASEALARATVQITFVHDDPDLSHEVPAVPG